MPSKIDGKKVHETVEKATRVYLSMVTVVEACEIGFDRRALPPMLVGWGQDYKAKQAAPYLDLRYGYNHDVWVLDVLHAFMNCINKDRVYQTIVGMRGSGKDPVCVLQDFMAAYSSEVLHGDDS